MVSEVAKLLYHHTCLSSLPFLSLLPPWPHLLLCQLSLSQFPLLLSVVYFDRVTITHACIIKCIVDYNQNFYF